MAEGNPSNIQALKDKIKFYEDLKAGGNMNMRGEQILHELRAKLAEEEGGGGAGGGAAPLHIPKAPVGAYVGSTTKVLDPATGRVLSRTKNPNAARGVDRRAAAAASTTKLAAHRNIAATTADFAKKVEEAEEQLGELLHFGQTEGPSKDELEGPKGQQAIAQALDLLRRWERNENDIQSRGNHIWYKPSLSVAGETLREQIYQLRTSLDWVHQEMSGGGRHRRTRRRRTRVRKTRRRRRKTKRRRRRRRRRRHTHDFDKELKRVIAQHRRYQIARGDKRFKATRGLVKWSRPNKTSRANRIYYRKRKKRTTRKHRRR